MEFTPQQLFHALKHKTGYDYVANHYSEMDKEDLKDLVLELIYAIGDHCSPAVEKGIFADVVFELRDRWEEDE